MFAFLTTVLLLIFTIVEGSDTATKSKCEVIKALRAEGVPVNDTRNWLCLVARESGYVYDDRDVNTDGSTDFGIFHFNDNYSCGKPNGTDSAICWKLRTFGCADTCESMLDANITNDANCAVRIRNCDGFNPWLAWKSHCSDVSGSEFDYSVC